MISACHLISEPENNLLLRKLLKLYYNLVIYKVLPIPIPIVWSIVQGRSKIFTGTRGKLESEKNAML